MTNLILCGGIGERLWPISRSHMPKQFSRFLNGSSLLQETVMRNSHLCSKLMMVTGETQHFLAQTQLQEMGMMAPFLLEPFGRGTAPAITLACLSLPPDEMVLMTPSDHHIGDLNAYKRAITEAMERASQGRLVLVGIKPGWGETGYGYIHSRDGQVLGFHEKPTFETACEYVRSGDYYWNSGILMFRVSDLLEEMEKWRPDVLSACRSAYQAHQIDQNEEIPIHQIAQRQEASVNQKVQPQETSFNQTLPHQDQSLASVAVCIRIPSESMAAIPPISVDHAVLEHCTRLDMVASDMLWSDMGSFESLHNALDADPSGNVVLGAERDNSSFLQVGSSGNLVYSESRRVAAIDVTGLMIVDTKDAILVGQLSSAQKVRELVGQLKREHSTLLESNESEDSPWGRCHNLLKEIGRASCRERV